MTHRVLGSRPVLCWFWLRPRVRRDNTQSCGIAGEAADDFVFIGRLDSNAPGRDFVPADPISQHIDTKETCSSASATVGSLPRSGPGFTGDALGDLEFPGKVDTCVLPGGNLLQADIHQSHQLQSGEFSGQALQRVFGGGVRSPRLWGHVSMAQGSKKVA
ncbi:MAG: hypothetical protein ACOYOL_12090, partial [Chthoniobacterales bacterium]